MAALTTLDIAWLAGLLEGEGTFYVRKRTCGDKQYKNIGIQVMMTDKEPIERVAALLGGSVSVQAKPTVTGKSIYRTGLHSWRSAGWMMTLYPLLSPRRQQQVRQCLDVWKEHCRYVGTAHG